MVLYPQHGMLCHLLMLIFILMVATINAFLCSDTVICTLDLTCIYVHTNKNPEMSWPTVYKCNGSSTI